MAGVVCGVVHRFDRGEAGEIDQQDTQHCSPDSGDKTVALGGG